MAIEHVPYNLTPEQVVEFWDGYMAGQTVAQLARRFGKKHAPMYERVQATGGMRPTIPTRAARHLTLEDREEISRGLAAGDSLRQIAARLGRCPSTISREVESNGGRRRYRAAAADRAAIRRRRRPKPCKLVATPQLARLVEAKLKSKWSPEQIAGWLKRTYPQQAELGRFRCLTRRSTAPCTCSPVVPSNANWPAIYAPIGKPAGPATATANVRRGRATWSG
jgi:IS30 family transposase